MVDESAPIDSVLLLLALLSFQSVMVIQVVTSLKNATLNERVPLLTPVIVLTTKLYLRSLVHETSFKHRDWFESRFERRRTIIFFNFRIYVSN